MYHINKDKHFVSLKISEVVDQVLLARTDTYIDYGAGPIIIERGDE